MPIRSLLIANRGEIAIRIARAAADLGIRSVAVYSHDDAESLHTRIADEAVGLDARGVPAYLDIEAIVAAAVAAGCDAVHPGYGFLAENAALARACADAGITFVGPSITNLELFGDKGRARAAAAESDVPTIPGIDRAVSLDEARAFLESLGPDGAVMLKALAGGGGRGTRAVQDAGRPGRDVRALPLGGDERLRQRRLVRRAVPAAGPPHRGADRGRPARRRRARRRARVLGAAPLPEDHRGRAGAAPARRPAQPHHQRGRPLRQPRGLRQPRHLRVPRRRLPDG